MEFVCFLLIREPWELKFPSMPWIKTFELHEIAFTKSFLDSCTTTALKCAIEYDADDVYVVGYDGYRGAVLSDKEADLTNENRTLFWWF